MTALAAILASVLHPAYLIIVGPIAIVGALFVWAEHRAPFDPYSFDREGES